eukprot:362851-Chlamydomonas_euryale.AAC.2
MKHVVAGLHRSLPQPSVLSTLNFPQPLLLRARPHMPPGPHIPPGPHLSSAGRLTERQASSATDTRTVSTAPDLATMRRHNSCGHGDAGGNRQARGGSVFLPGGGGRGGQEGVADGEVRKGEKEGVACTAAGHRGWGREEGKKGWVWLLHGRSSRTQGVESRGGGRRVSLGGCMAGAVGRRGWGQGEGEGGRTPESGAEEKNWAHGSVAGSASSATYLYPKEERDLAHRSFRLWNDAPTFCTGTGPRAALRCLCIVLCPASENSRSQPISSEHHCARRSGRELGVQVAEAGAEVEAGVQVAEAGAEAEAGVQVAEAGAEAEVGCASSSLPRVLRHLVA